jgi:hypothetical protein
MSPIVGRRPHDDVRTVHRFAGGDRRRDAPLARRLGGRLNRDALTPRSAQACPPRSTLPQQLGEPLRLATAEDPALHTGFDGALEVLVHDPGQGGCAQGSLGHDVAACPGHAREDKPKKPSTTVKLDHGNPGGKARIRAASSWWAPRWGEASCRPPCCLSALSGPPTRPGAVGMARTGWGHPRDLEGAPRLGADIVGVRGSACEGGRKGTVSAARVRALRAALLHEINRAAVACLGAGR